MKNENYYKLAKKEDKDGSWAYTGMVYNIASYFNLKPYTACGEDVNCLQAIEYILDTYLECIDSVNLEEWLDNGNEDGKVLILNEYEFQEKYSEIFKNNFSTQGAIDDIAIIYGCEWWTFSYTDSDLTYFATTTYKDYKVIDNKRIGMAMERLLTLREKEIDADEDREEFICSINLAMNNFFDYPKAYEMDADELLDAVNRVTGGYLE